MHIYKQTKTDTRLDVTYALIYLKAEEKQGLSRGPLDTLIADYPHNPDVLARHHRTSAFGCAAHACACVRGMRTALSTDKRMRGPNAVLHFSPPVDVKTNR